MDYNVLHHISKFIFGGILWVFKIGLELVSSSYSTDTFFSLISSAFHMILMEVAVHVHYYNTSNDFLLFFLQKS